MHKARWATLNRRAWALRWRAPARSRALAEAVLASVRSGAQQRSPNDAPDPDAIIAQAEALRCAAWQLKWLGRFAESEKACDEALSLDPKIVPGDVKSELFSTLGLIHYSRGAYHTAAQMLERGLGQLPPNARPEARIDLYAHRSAVLRYMGDETRSGEDLERAIALSHASGQLHEQARIFHNAARYEFAQGDYRAGLDMAQEADALAKRTRNRLIQPYIDEILGACLLKLNRVDEALERLEPALQVGTQLGDKRVVSQILLQLAEAHRLRSRPQHALACCARGASLANAMEYPLWLRYFHKLEAEIHEELGHYERALAAHKAFAEIDQTQTRNKSLNRLRGAQAELKQAEARERQLYDELAHASRLAALGRLTGGIAHDFNNLLSIIGGNAELMALEPENTEKSLKEILQTVARGADMTRSLLAFARKQPLKALRVDTGAALGNAERMISRMLPARIELDVTNPGDLWPCLVDETELGNALLNLAINARDAMPMGGRLRMRAQNRAIKPRDGYSEIMAGPFVEFRISDTGAGIPADVLDHVFDPFFTTKPHGEGPGLGLSRVQGFVRQSGGDIRIKSLSGEGTEVRFVLPVADEAVRRTGAPIPAPENTRAIVLVEDDDGLRQLLTRALSAAGHDVTSFETADAAMEASALVAAADLVITDVQMPGVLDGFGLVRRLRTQIDMPPVVYMSAFFEESARAPEQEGEIFLSKPFALQQLNSAIDEVLAS